MVILNSMANTLLELEDRIAEEGLNRENLLNFLRLLPTNGAEAIKDAIVVYFGQLKDSGVEIDEELVSRMIGDMEQHGRIQPETIQGAPPRPHITLVEE